MGVGVGVLVTNPSSRAADFLRPPHNLNVEQVGFLISSVALTYMLLALPLGWLTDVLNQGGAAGRRLKSVQVCGWLGTLGGAALLGPARPLLAAAGLPPSVELAAFPLIGASCALKIIPSLPDLQRGLEAEDEAARAAICAMWSEHGSGFEPWASVPFVPYSVVRRR